MPREAKDLRRSVTIIGLMGVIGMVLISMLGASYVGKVGGAAAIPQLREDLLARHGVVVENDAEFKVRPVVEGEGERRERGLLVRFIPVASILTVPGRLDDRMRMIASQIFSKPKWAKQLDFVEVVALVGEKEIRLRLTRQEALTRVGLGRPTPASR